MLIDELLVVGHDRLGDSLADCVDCRNDEKEYVRKLGS